MFFLSGKGAEVDDNVALEIGRQVLSGLDSSLGDEAAYKTSRYFIDRWLADLGSSAKETDPLSVNLLTKFDSFKMDQISIWIKEQVPEEPSNLESSEERKQTGNDSNDDASASSDASSTFAEDSVDTGNEWETAPLDQRGYALVAVDALDTMCSKLAPTFPVLQEIRRAIYPCLFLENGEAFTPVQSKADKQQRLQAAADHGEELELQNKQSEPYTSRKFFFEGASNEENLRRAAETLAAKAHLEAMRGEVNMAKREAAEARLAKEAAENLFQSEQGKVEVLDKKLLEAAAEKERFLSEIQKHRNEKRSFLEKKKADMDAFKQRERESHQLSAGDMEQKMATLQEQFKTAEANFVKTNDELKASQKALAEAKDVIDSLEIDIERKTAALQAELDQAIAQRKKAYADAAKENERTSKLHDQMQILQQELDSRTNGASKLIRQIEEMEAARLAREAEFEEILKSTEDKLNGSWKAELDKASQKIDELGQKAASQNETIESQRGKIWERDARLDDAAALLRSTKEKLEERIEFLTHMIEGRNADIEVCPITKFVFNLLFETSLENFPRNAEIKARSCRRQSTLR